MTEKLETVLDKVSAIPNPVNSSLIQENFISSSWIITDQLAIRRIILRPHTFFSHELAPNITFYDIQKKEKILEFLNKRIKPKTVDPNKKWVTTWNDDLGRFSSSFGGYTITRSRVWRELPADML